PAQRLRDRASDWRHLRDRGFGGAGRRGGCGDRGAAQDGGHRQAAGGDRDLVGGGSPLRAGPGRRGGGGKSAMTELEERLARLTEEQRRLLEKRVRERGLDTPLAGRASKGGVATQDPDESDPQAWRGRRPARPLRFSLYFFSDDGSRETGAKYRLAFESARFADANGFDAVWTPERHFQPFGGLYPNPSVLSAALAAITSRVGIRAGSVALPLHHPVRVAEEWSVVDNLSGGRVAVSFASGWHPDDFVLTPSPYDDRKEVMFRGIETIRRLWAGETILLEGPQERRVEVR